MPCRHCSWIAFAALLRDEGSASAACCTAGTQKNVPESSSCTQQMLGHMIMLQGFQQRSLPRSRCCCVGFAAALLPESNGLWAAVPYGWLAVMGAAQTVPLELMGGGRAVCWASNL
jgi:hypothetical protein